MTRMTLQFSKKNYLPSEFCHDSDPENHFCYIYISSYIRPRVVQQRCATETNFLMSTWNLGGMGDGQARPATWSDDAWKAVWFLVCIASCLFWLCVWVRVRACAGAGGCVGARVWLCVCGRVRGCAGVRGWARVSAGECGWVRVSSGECG